MATAGAAPRHQSFSAMRLPEYASLFGFDRCVIDIRAMSTCVGRIRASVIPLPRDGRSFAFLAISDDAPKEPLGTHETLLTIIVARSATFSGDGDGPAVLA